jgi:succinyl-diaminopimelate desuccinylase
MNAPTFDAAIRFAQDLIRTPGAPGSEGDVARRVLHEMQTLGFDEARHDEVGNVIGVLHGSGEGPTVMLSSHIDVVDIGEAGSWEHPPFGGVIADGFLHGRGAMDIKGPLALQTYAAAAARAAGMQGTIIVAHTVLEERGGWGMEHLLESGTVRPDAIIIGESTNGDVCIGHRGRAELLIEVAGVAGHASAPERARSPLDALPTLVPALRDFAAQLGSADVLGHSTLAATAIETLPRSRNVIPDLLRIVIDWRVLPGTTAAGAIEQLRSFLETRVDLGDATGFTIRSATEQQSTWTGLSEERTLFTPGFLMPADHPIVRAAAAAVAAGTGRTPAVRPWTFATDGGHSCGIHGIPTIGFAPGEERFAHTNRERLALADAEIAFNTYPSLIAAVREAIRQG